MAEPPSTRPVLELLFNKVIMYVLDAGELYHSMARFGQPLDLLLN